MRVFLISATLLLLFAIAKSQPQKDDLRSKFKVVAEVPVEFGVGYEWHYSRRFSSALQFGVLTPPNSNMILSALEAMGTSEEVVSMLNSAFKFGLVYKANCAYHFRKNYSGVYLQVINLTGKDTPTELVEAAMWVDVSSYPRRPGSLSATPKNLTLKSTLVQAGVFYGRRFTLNMCSEVDVEFAVSANVGSSSSLYSDSRNLESLSSYTNSYLADTYKSYAFIPSLSIVYCYRLRK